MTQRYWAQADFLSVGDLPGMIFERADLNGVYRYVGGKPDIPAGSNHRFIFVVIKRGYLPEIIEGSAPLNQRHTIRVRLKDDPSYRPNALMEEFDRLMAQAKTVAPGEDPTALQRMHQLDSLYQRARALALELEQAQMPDEASAVYWALADFPEVIRDTMADGRTQITGYRNTRQDAQSEADRLKAIQLNAKVPKLLVDKWVIEKGFPPTGIRSAAHGRAFLDAFQMLAEGQWGQHILPSDYRVAIAQTLRWATPDEACAMIQSAYRFEPQMMQPRQWNTRLDDLRTKRAQLKQPGPECVLN